MCSLPVSSSGTDPLAAEPDLSVDIGSRRPRQERGITRLLTLWPPTSCVTASHLLSLSVHELFADFCE